MLKPISPIALIPVGIFAFLGGAALGRSRKGLSMIAPRKATVGGEAGVWIGEWKRPLTTEKFLGSMPAQYVAFKRSMSRMAPRVSGFVGADVDGEKCSLSGLLGVGHLAGEAGVESWVKNPDVRSRFKSTTANFARTNGIF